ncbi:TolC family protein [Dysgonomonas sp. GY617]|uniref:TolC family protein n=1 Tax=Dysgonomonas sp. GY617 TaxID=2780420 RepID=UPI001883CC6E|nr:TolC family protein [Dysgonomonas sp. GY617]MBF0575055.1 TolC family protein [Dysgonomonas sp. GY617]
MFKHLITSSIVSLLCSATLLAQDTNVELSLEQSMQLAHNGNKSLKIATKEIEWAKNEHQRINSFWLPSINATGAYMHMSNKIEVKQPLSDYTNPAKDYIHSIYPGEQIISSALDKLGSQSLNVPLVPQNFTTIDANLTLPLFTGGKRIYAGRISKQMISVANVNKEQIDAGVQILLVENYYGLRLGNRIVDVKEKAYESLNTHYQNALKLEENGMINKAERLFVKVNLDEAKRELEAARKDLDITQKSFKVLIKMETEDTISPVSSLFINDSVPSLSYFKGLIKDNNYMVKQMKIQKDIAGNQLKIANAAYVPNIALLGKQTVYANGIERSLLPRTFIGAGFTWNIFDGFNREKKIKQARIAQQILDIESEKIIDDNELGIDKLYNQMQNALDNITTLTTTIEMSKELLRIRKLAYQEGMSTSTEVVDAEVILSKIQIASLLAYYEYDVALINLLSVCGIPQSFDQYSNNGKTEQYIFNR